MSFIIYFRTQGILTNAQNWHMTEKSEAFDRCKEMPVILVNKVADKKILIERKGAAEAESHSGLLHKKRTNLLALAQSFSPFSSRDGRQVRRPDPTRATNLFSKI
jgi:hypothetical protein